jgi:hypothetical protein
MGVLQLFLHWLGFVAPAFFVAVVAALGARFVGAAPQPLRWWVQAAVNFAVGVAVLAAGLWHFGVDGKMATYATLAVAVATAQWLGGRAWKT